MEPAAVRRCPLDMTNSPGVRRRTVLALGGAALLLGGCRETARQPAAGASTSDLLLADSTNGLVLLRDSRASALPGTVVAADTPVAFATSPAGADATTLTVFDLGGTGPRTTVRLTGRWTTRLVHPGGTMAVLTAADEPAARTGTALLIVDRHGETHRFSLPGNLVPDALTTDAGGLFLLDWLPPDAPDRYRVRQLEFADGTAQPLFTRDKVPVANGTEEEMRGDGRHSVLAPDRTMQYTLYTHQPDHQHTRDLVAGRPASGAHAFVHCLHLGERWAYCMDLPDPFGHAAPDAYAIAVSPSGKRLVVIDAAAGKIALADTGSLTVASVSDLPAGGGPASAAVGPDGVLYVATGTGIQLVRLDGATIIDGWRLPAPVLGLAISRDGKRVAVGQADAVLWLDSFSGRILGRVPTPGLTSVREIR
jgi:hypothetical protein